MSQAKQIAAFSPEAQAAVKSREISGNWELRKLVKVLGELAHFDEVNERATKRAFGWMIGMIVLGFLGVFFGFIMLEETALGFLVPLAGGIAAFLFGRRWKRLEKLDMINDFRISVRPLLKDVAADLAPDAKIKVVRMDLSGPVDRKKEHRGVKNGKLTGAKATFFQDPWCEIRVPLIDGSTAVLEFDIGWTRLEVRKTNARGKTKLKTKWRKECTACATMIPAQFAQWNHVGLSAQVDPGREKLKYVNKDGITAARMERFWVYKSTGNPPPEAPPAPEVIGMLVRLHSAMGIPSGGGVRQ